MIILLATLFPTHTRTEVFLGKRVGKLVGGFLVGGAARSIIIPAETHFAGPSLNRRSPEDSGHATEGGRKENTIRDSDSQKCRVANAEMQNRVSGRASCIAPRLA